MVSLALVVLTYAISTIVVALVLWTKAESDARQQLSDASHVILKELQGRQTQFATQNYPKGIYLLKIQFADEQIVKKLIFSERPL
jgi:uncharacterized protein YdgA (DUF945 family)